MDWQIALRCLMLALIFHGCSVIEPISTPAGSAIADQLIEHVSQGDVGKVRELLSKGVDPNVADHNGATPLHHAVINDIEMVRLLLSAGARVDTPTLGRTTPLMWAAHYGRTEAARLLLEKGTDVNWRGSHEETPLIEAVLHRHVETAAVLLDHGAEVNVVTVEGATALDFAVQSGDLKMIQLLRDAGAETKIKRTMTYEAGEVGEAVIEGTITFKGTPPPPKTFDLEKFPQPIFCSQVDNDGKGHRILREVTVNNGKLQDVVVLIQEISKGKPFVFKGTDVTIEYCKYLVQGGPSTFVGVVVNGGEIRILNGDADPSDPKSATGVLHNPHAYEVQGGTSATMFNKPLPNKGQVLIETVKLRRPGSFMKLEKDQGNYANAYFYPITNPYYAIVGPNGTYVIDQVPPGKYTLIAWHPILGAQEKEIEVGETGTVRVDFEFSKAK